MTFLGLGFLKKISKKGYEKEKEKHIKRLEEIMKKSKGRLRRSLSGKFHY